MFNVPYYVPPPSAEAPLDEPECCSCGRPADQPDFVGFQIQPVTFFRGGKSGRMVAETDFLPNGKDRLILCFECVPDELLLSFSFGARE